MGVKVIEGVEAKELRGQGVGTMVSVAIRAKQTSHVNGTEHWQK